MSRDHRNLEAFRSTDEFVLAIYQVSKLMPREEMFGLTSQMRRAAVSAAAKIVEGAARSSERDFVHFLGMALGSLREAGYHLSLALRLGYFDSDAAKPAQALYEQSARLLAGLIRSFGDRVQ